MTYGGGPGEDESARIRPFLGVPTPQAEPPPAQPGAPAPRPFVLTSGRVGGRDSDIGLETQVTACLDTAGQPPPVRRLTTERQAIVVLCERPMSVAEISARLHLHLDVTRILVDDLRAAGYLEVHALDAVNPNDPATILRVIRGLRALT